VTAHASEDKQYFFKSSGTIHPTTQHHISQHLNPTNSAVQTTNHAIYTAVQKINDTNDTKMERKREK
jgi:hypothetical protein